MADTLRILSICCAITGALFALMGANALLVLLQNSSNTDTWVMLAAASRAFFLIFFGCAAAMICFDDQGRRFQRISTSFGFLVTWSGRGVFFLVMGLYLFPVVCRAGGNCVDDFSNRNVPIMNKVGIVAAVSSLILGVIIIVFRLTKLSESHSWEIIGTRRTIQALDIAAAIGSCGMILLAILRLQAFSSRNRALRDTFGYLAEVFILLTFGVASLLSSLRQSGFIDVMFGFLAFGLQRGIFYLLMGFYTFVVFQRGNDDLIGWICFGCSVCSIVAGTFILVMHMC